MTATPRMPRFLALAGVLLAAGAALPGQQRPDLAAVLEKVLAAGDKVETTDATDPLIVEAHRRMRRDAVISAAKEALLRYRRFLRSGEGLYFRGRLHELAHKPEEAWQDLQGYLRGHQDGAYYHDACLAASMLAWNYGDGDEQAARLFDFVRPQRLRSPDARARYAQAKKLVDGYKARASLHGAPAPPINPLEVIQGPPDISLEQFRGKVVICGFWATWIPECLTNIREVVELQDRHAGEVQAIALTHMAGKAGDFSRPGAQPPLQVPIATGISPQRELELLRAAHAALKMTFPLVVMTPGTAKGLWGVEALPTTYVIGRDGRVVGHVVGIGERNSARLRALVEQALSR